MDGIEILNSFKKETIYEFSEAISEFDEEIHIIFKVEIVSIDINPSKTRLSKIKEIINGKGKLERLISQLDITPIAYLLKSEIETGKYEYTIEAMNEKYDSFIEKNKDKLLEEFLKI